MTYVIGLTGGIGSGKTLVSDHFATLGVPIIDTDVIARQIVEPGQAALTALVKEFGDNILLSSGQLDRAELRKLAFQDSESKQKLDQITHPAIWNETVLQVNKVTAPYCLVVVPLLSANSPLTSMMQRVLLVSADKEVKIQRVKIRSGLSRDEIEAIMKTQLDDDNRRQFSDDVIENNTTIDDAHRAVELLHQQYMQLASVGSD